ncbi:DUF305 domain-containing protein [Actinokineospora xionganensis]|nr:DUF305 domain-containing protein [Actinokineospora xionganensis]
MRTKLIRGVIVAVFGAALVAGCGSAAEPGNHSGGQTATHDRNDADVKFATDMIPHHSQAVEMSALAPTRAASPEVRGLAQRIQAAQDPEIKLMQGWLTGWGVSGGHSNTSQSGGHDADSMQGMMSVEQMTRLREASGAAFDRMFLEMMIEHHEGAITMSEKQLAEGKSEQAKTLAGEIIKAQKAEIIEMRKLLGTG